MVFLVSPLTYCECVKMCASDIAGVFMPCMQTNMLHTYIGECAEGGRQVGGIECCKCGSIPSK